MSENESVEVRIAELEAQLAAARAEAGTPGLITATTMGNGSVLLRPVKAGEKSATAEQKAEAEMLEEQQKAQAEAAKNAAEAAKQQADAQQKAAEEAQKQAEQAEKDRQAAVKAAADSTKSQK